MGVFPIDLDPNNGLVETLHVWNSFGGTWKERPSWQKAAGLEPAAGSGAALLVTEEAQLCWLTVTGVMETDGGGSMDTDVGSMDTEGLFRRRHNSEELLTRIEPSLAPCRNAMLIILVS